MTPSTTHEEMIELLGAFALDAVDPDEQQAVEDHLRECPRCRDEVARHREVAARLAYAGAQAPDGLWGRIATRLEPAEPEPDLSNVYPFRPRAGRVRSSTVGLVAAAALVAVVVGVLGWEVRQQGQRVQHISAALAMTSMDRAAAQASLDPRSTRFALASPDGRIQLGAVIAADGTGYLVAQPAHPLPILSSDRTYQLWGVVGGKDISMGVLGPKPGLVAFRAPRASALAITAEVAGGVIQPSGAPVAIGFVPPGAA